MRRRQCESVVEDCGQIIDSPEYFNILNHLAVCVDTQRSFMLSHWSKDRGNFCKWEQSLNVTQSIIAFRSSSHTNDNDVIIKNNTKQPVFGNEKSTDILATDILCSFYTNRRGHAHTTINKATATMKINTIQNNQSWALERNIRAERGKCYVYFLFSL